MAKSKHAMLDVKGTKVSVLSVADLDYISLTNMLRAKDREFIISEGV